MVLGQLFFTFAFWANHTLYYPRLITHYALMVNIARIRFDRYKPAQRKRSCSLSSHKCNKNSLIAFFMVFQDLIFHFPCRITKLITALNAQINCAPVSLIEHPEQIIRDKRPLLQNFAPWANDLWKLYVSITICAFAAISVFAQGNTSSSRGKKL